MANTKTSKENATGAPPRASGARRPSLSRPDGFTPIESNMRHRRIPLRSRDRSDSAGSTRGAFGPLPASLTSPTKTKSPTKSKTPEGIVISPEKEISGSRRKKKRTPKQAETPSPEKLLGAEMDLGDMASLAFASMGADNLGGLINDHGNAAHRDGVSLQPSSPPPRHPPHSSTTPKQRIHRDSSHLSDDDNVYFRHENGVKPRETSESADSGSVSLPFFEHIKKFDKPIREDSLQYSGVMMDSIMSKLSYRGSLEPDPPLTSLQPENSLVGASLLDDVEPSGSAAPMVASQARSKYGSVVMSSPPAAAPPTTTASQQQQQDIARFSSLVQESAAYGEQAARVTPLTPQSPDSPTGDKIQILPKPPLTPPPNTEQPYHDSPFGRSWRESATYATEEEIKELQQEPLGWWDRVKATMDPTPWLEADVFYDDDGTAHFEEPHRMVSRVLRQLLYTPEVPEFTSLQQFSWAILLGISMGIYTAVWKNLIEFCVEFMWKKVPETLYDWGVFTDLDGAFPLPHYMWICPSVFGGVLSYVFVVLPKPIPGQNEWIKSLHSRGVQDHETFWTLFFLSTAGMASGLSLGPELPLVLSAGMIGSYLGVATRQSILSARAMNLTAASAAVAGFFGFPMAGALFVLEIPHRMGLQYFEALSPATIASIVAVLVNRMILQNDVTGYYNYPFLTMSLPSHIFYIAIIYGIVGGLLGVFYCDCVKWVKTMVHDLFHVKDNGDTHDLPEQNDDESIDLVIQRLSDDGPKDETVPLVPRMNSTVKQKLRNIHNAGFLEKIGRTTKGFFSFGIAHEPTRAAVAGTLAGFLTGVICMFVPHVLFWGEAQLQTLIDKGRTPLPVFGSEGETSADLIAYGFCLIDPKDSAAIEAGFSVGCSALLSFAKILVVGLSLGTGIVGGHFWGPLFVGCAASHLFTDVLQILTGWTGYGANLSAYPCTAILCIMGSSHVVAFRAHTAIMLILTLTINAFSENDAGPATAGDYSAVFPLLVVSCFVSLMVTRDTVFYKEQRSRGDIMAAPEVLCEPGKEGMPMVVDHIGDEDYDSEDSSFYASSSNDDDDSIMAQTGIRHNDLSSSSPRRPVDALLTQVDIEEAFLKAQLKDREASNMIYSAAPQDVEERRPPSIEALNRMDSDRKLTLHQDPCRDKLTELLSKPFDKKPKGNRHRRVRSTNDVDPTLPPPSFRKPGHSRSGSNISIGRRSRSDSQGSRKSITDERLMHVTSFGELSNFHPSLFDHARQRSASMVNRPPSLPKSGRHSRKSSDVSISGYSDVIVAGGVLSHEDVERSFGTTAVSLTSSGGSQDNATSSRTH